MKLCDYGCGQEGIFITKKSPEKWCCSKYYSQCPEIKNKNSKGQIGKIRKKLTEEHKQKLSIALTGKVHTEERKQKISNSLKGRPFKCQNENERRRKISETRKRKGLGGYRPGSGRGKQGWYKEYWCDSSWELAFVIYHLDHNISFKRNWKKFKYIFEGKIRNYLPDFIYPCGTYIEISGYHTKQKEEKLKQFNGKILLLNQEEIKPYLDYVKNKYGNDFIKLYGELRWMVGNMV